ncbi:purine-nucleoside phosphorylase [Rhodanobacter lindaniclasticus]|jgi:purine-nucleoside phosphorylase|uniref:Purine nucleoside phosphorylase DeoD-type n=1 Tax=Rhodanobacter lindaniclasticus TaxID=75310 RepID=A0A4S3KJD9_9GAMM|nr:purine-nucleoside phosphorylase [Rhodanobacter lindaniclasticus]THD08730.1 purine-nucleoside phosphorylase [Rhodanobacter lindaniclasticus]
MSTPHLDARPGDIADTVLLPGDPLRARHIAHEFLDGVVEVNTRRNMLGYSGHYRGMRVSVIGSGMGIPSCAIYATELARVFGVRRIVRVGTCGGVGDVALGDLLLAQAASTDSNFNRLQFGGHDLAACADFGLMRAIADTASTQGIGLRIGGVFSTDCFHGGDPELAARLLQHHIHGIEMESAGLYGVAMREGFRAVSVLTVSDHVQRGTHMPAVQREQGLSRMTALVLDSLLPAPGDRGGAIWAG